MTAPNWVISRSRDFLLEEEGGIAAISAIVAMAICGVMAFSLELGLIHIEKRRQQSANDLAAIAAAADPANALKAAQESLRANGYTETSIKSLKLGGYQADPSIPVANRFAAGSPLGLVAVELKLERNVPLLFGAILGGSKNQQQRIETSAVGASKAEAAFSIGSRLASLDGGIANALLGGMLGGSVSLSMMDYTALASAKIEMFGYIDALATRTSVKAATYNDVLVQSVALPLALQSIADMPSVDPAARSAASLLRSQLSSRNTPVSLASWLSLGPDGDRLLKSGGPLTLSVSALDLVSALARIASGPHQVDVELAGALPTGTSIKLSLGIGEPMQSGGYVRAGAPTSMVRTAQTRLLFVVSQKLAGTSGLTIPLYIEAASGQAQLSAVSCGQAPAATLAVKPSIAEAWIADPASLSLIKFTTRTSSAPATLANVGGLRLTAQAHAAMTNLNPTNVAFTNSDISNGNVKTVSTSQAVTTLLASLVGNTSVGVSGVSLLGGVTTQTVAGVLTTTLPALDGVVASTLTILGVKLGSADVIVTGVRCGAASLAR